jgi:predicted amidophosphoribosyltransferase
VLRRIAALAAPPLCAVCGDACPAADALCGRCEAELLASPPPLIAAPAGTDLAFAAAQYEGAALAVVHALKFSRRIGLARAAAAAVAAACPGSEWRGTIVAVPPSPLRWRWRGFDPAEEIAIALAEILGLPLARPLRRLPGPRQVGRDRAERIDDPPRVRARGRAPSRVLLVDDVRTTGATLSACARELRSAGAERVVALTFAASR